MAAEVNAGLDARRNRLMRLIPGSHRSSSVTDLSRWPAPRWPTYPPRVSWRRREIAMDATSSNAGGHSHHGQHDHAAASATSVGPSTQTPHTAHAGHTGHTGHMGHGG